MADRYPLIYNPSANQIQELQSGDSLDVGNSSIKGATGYATTTGTSSQFLKADGSIDSTSYLTSSGTAQLAQGLTGTPTIAVSDITGVNATFSGNLTVNGTTTTLDTNLTEVDKIEVTANNNNVAVAITQIGAGKAMTVEGGDVGIGTAVPAARLHVAKSTEPSLYITNDSTGHTNADGLQIGFDGSNDAQIRNRENTNLKVYTNNTPRLTINGGGSVGIGTENPSTNLDIVGNIRLSAADPNIQLNDGGPRLRVPTGNTLTIHTGGNLGTSDYERLRITSSGDIGIGTDAPATNFKLDVNGDLSLGEFGGSDNTYIDQKQNGSLEIINSGRDANSGDIRINRTNSISGDTTYFRDFRVYDGKGTTLLFVDGSAAGVGINSTAPTGTLDVGGNILPDADNTRDLGSASKRWANLYTGDLNLSNEGAVNDVDGTWGQYTIQEGENDLFLINRRTGKKYKFNLTEVN